MLSVQRKKLISLFRFKKNKIPTRLLQSVEMCGFEKVKLGKEGPSEEVDRLWETGIPFPSLVLPT